MYVVYSYGTHWPLFVFDTVDRVWYENSDKYSTSTSKQRGQAHPHVDTTKASKSLLNRLIANGAKP